MDDTFSTPTPPPPPREFRPGHKHGASTPVLISMYANRPLPPLPPEAFAQLQATQTSLRQRRATAPEGVAPSGRVENAPTVRSRDSKHDSNHPPLPSPPFVLTGPSPTPSPTQNGSFTPPGRSSRRASQKIHQLIGQDVDVMKDHAKPSGPVGSDSLPVASKYRLDSIEVPDYHLVPVLEPDDNGSSSRGSSWGPMPPDSAAVPAPLIVHKPNLDGSDKKDDTLSPSIAQLRLDDELTRPWHPSYGHFSDVGAAGEYHRFITATSRHSRQVSAESFLAPAAPEVATKKKKRSSFSFARSAAAKFSRRRDQADPIDTSGSNFQQQQQQQQRPSSAKSFFATSPRSSSATSRVPIDVAPPRPPPAPPLMSAWDSDSDDAEGPVMAHLKEWFAHRSGEEGKGHRRTSSAPRTSPDMRTSRHQEIHYRAQEKAREKRAQAEREVVARRKEDMRKSLHAIAKDPQSRYV